MTNIKTPKKLIEVALPLDDINAAAAREKSIRHGHPSTLHLWWARRPLAAARAVIFAQMVNDPGYQQGDGFKYGVNKKEAAIEREKLFAIIRDLVKWENTNNEEVLGRARTAIQKSWRETCELNKDHPQADELFNPDKLPALHDPFAGGGAIPLEAQRLGLEAYASDLNPVAVMINKAMIEIPPKFANRAPIGPIPEGEQEQHKTDNAWPGATSLAEDVRRYGHWMREEAFKRIGHLYPKVKVTKEMAAERPDLEDYIGRELTVIAWLWARTVKSPNPAFSNVDVPLARSFMLSTKKGKEAWVEPVIGSDGYEFVVRMGKLPEDAIEGTVQRTGGTCLMSDTAMPFPYIREEAKAGRMGERLMAIVAEGTRGRVYLSPTEEMERIARSAEPDDVPETNLPEKALGFRIQEYGMLKHRDLFTPRQLVALTTFSDLVQEAREKAIGDYLERGRLALESSRVHPQKTYHRSHLPHFEAGTHPQHIIIRLADSLPQSLLRQWGEELKHLPKEEKEAEQRKRFDNTLDKGYGNCYLQQPDIAEQVRQALLHFDGERYTLHTWSIMPNHVHVLVTPLHGNSLSSILHTWKSYTAKQANRLLSRQGKFWQDDYFDRYIRDEGHFQRTARYIEENPVRAGLCATADAWPFGSAGEKASRPAPTGERASYPAPAGERASRPLSTDGTENGESRAGRPRSSDDVPLAEGGMGATAYGDAVAIYLGLGVSKLSDTQTSLCRWKPQMNQSIATFGRHALPMVWDFSEANAFCGQAGDFSTSLKNMMRVLGNLGQGETGYVKQGDASTQTTSREKVVSTDPPYYDNIGYADLSDFFYVWMRRSLRSIYPDLFSTMTVPKAEELVATPYRHGNKEAAEIFFLDGMTQAIHNLAEQGHPAFPVTIYYAFKQSETKDARTSNTGWETFLEAVMRAGFAIVGTWPMRTELANRMIGMGTNALASSVVLVCQKRAVTAETISRRDFQRQLRAEMPEALATMIGISDEGSSAGTAAPTTPVSPVAPVDLAQAAIGPGMGIFSRYESVLSQDGTPMSVHDALILINRSITDYLNPDSGNFDNDTLFCDSWFAEYGWSAGAFGQANTLAQAKGTTVDGVHNAGVIESGQGRVRLLRWEEYPPDWTPEHDNRTPAWEATHQLIRALNKQGESGAGALLARMPQRGESIRQLAYHLYTLCERKGWAEDARAYNELITAWQGIVGESHNVDHVGSQGDLGI